MTGQNQYDFDRSLTGIATAFRRRGRRLADATRFPTHQRRTRVPTTVAGGAAVAALAFVALPTSATWLVVVLLVATAWGAVLLFLTLPTAAERAGDELARRLAHFRHVVNAIGDAPTRAQLEGTLQVARDLALHDDEIADELVSIRASLAALTLAEELQLQPLPAIAGVSGLPAGETCHGLAPVRVSGKGPDRRGHLIFTTGGLTFRQVRDLHLAWRDVTGVQRAGADLIITARSAGRTFRFDCASAEAAARYGVLAEQLRSASVRTAAPVGAC